MKPVLSQFFQNPRQAGALKFRETRQLGKPLLQGRLELLKGSHMVLLGPGQKKLLPGYWTEVISPAWEGRRGYGGLHRLINYIFKENLGHVNMKEILFVNCT
jgi:hypothetical protein